ncbi:TSUP family transporter [Mesoplasma photuris]|uniref:TSUP family transporter n=1 Tax=Mesoplasma photuris TaxID=217731 RepID=UPI0004E17261|nr:TSUP family transporter [Mesoplasma photuris]
MSIVLLIFILFLLGFFVSSLGSISGVGGGVIFVPALMILLSLEPFENIKFVSNLLVFITAAINVGINFYKKRINLLTLGVIACIALPSILFGNYLATLFDTRIIKIIIVVVLTIVTILLILFEYYFKNKIKIKIHEEKKWYLIKSASGNYINWMWIALITFMGCLMTSLTGMGGGPVIMPMLLLILMLEMKEASSLSHSIIAIASLINVVYSYQFFADGDLMLQIAIPMIVGSVLGTFVAIKIKKYIKKEIIIKWILIVLIWISIIKMILDLI